MMPIDDGAENLSDVDPLTRFDRGIDGFECRANGPRRSRDFDRDDWATGKIAREYDAPGGWSEDGRAHSDLQIHTTMPSQPWLIRRIESTGH